MRKLLVLKRRKEVAIAKRRPRDLVLLVSTSLLNLQEEEQKRVNYRRRDLFMKGLGQTSEWWVHILTRVILPSVLEYAEFREGRG